MIRKKLSYNIHYADYACISGTLPHDFLGFTSATKSSSGQLVGVTTASCFTKHEDHSIMTAILTTEVFIFDDKIKQINHYDLLFAFTVE